MTVMRQGHTRSSATDEKSSPKSRFQLLRKHVRINLKSEHRSVPKRVPSPPVPAIDAACAREIFAVNPSRRLSSRPNEKVSC